MDTIKENKFFVFANRYTNTNYMVIFSKEIYYNAIDLNWVLHLTLFLPSEYCEQEKIQKNTSSPDFSVNLHRLFISPNEQTILDKTLDPKWGGASFTADYMWLYNTIIYSHCESIQEAENIANNNIEYAMIHLRKIFERNAYEVSKEREVTQDFPLYSSDKEIIGTVNISYSLEYKESSGMWGSTIIFTIDADEQGKLPKLFRSNEPFLHLGSPEDKLTEDFGSNFVQRLPDGKCKSVIKYFFHTKTYKEFDTAVGQKDFIIAEGLNTLERVAEHNIPMLAQEKSETEKHVIKRTKSGNEVSVLLDKSLQYDPVTKNWLYSIDIWVPTNSHGLVVPCVRGCNLNINDKIITLPKNSVDHENFSFYGNDWYLTIHAWDDKYLVKERLELEAESVSKSIMKQIDEFVVAKAKCLLNK